MATIPMAAESIVQNLVREWPGGYESCWVYERNSAKVDQHLLNIVAKIDDDVFCVSRGMSQLEEHTSASLIESIPDFIKIVSNVLVSLDELKGRRLSPGLRDVSINYLGADRCDQLDHVVEANVPTGARG